MFQNKRSYLSLVAITAGILGTVVVAGDPTNTAFTYQGQLKQNGSPVTYNCDFDVALFDSASGGTALATDTIYKVAVVNGLFTLLPDFGVDWFDGSPRFIEITVSCGPPGPTILSPRQEITPTPESFFSQSTRGIFVDDTGRVGIGTESPSSALHLLNGETAIALNMKASGSWTAGLRQTNASVLSLFNSGSDRLTIQPSGNVGIGTTTPESKLEVVGDGDPTLSLQSESSSGQDTGLSIRGARNGTTTADAAFIDLRNFDDNEGDGTDFAMARIAAGMADVSGQTGYLRFKTNDGTGLKEQMRIDKHGNVGIGTTTPSAALHLRDPGTEVELKMSAGGSWTAGIRQTNSSLLSLFNGDGATDRLTITPAGNVGIGTISPTSSLHVDGIESNGSDATVRIQSSGQSLLLDGNGIDSTGPLYLNTNNANIVSIASDGGKVGIGTTSPSEMLHVNGNIRVTGDILTDETIGYVTLSGVAFRDMENTFLDYYRSTPHVVNRFPGLPFEAIAPVQLPHGSRIIALRATVEDFSAGAGQSVRVRLERTSRGSDIFSTDIIAETSSVSVGGQILSTTNIITPFADVDNQFYSYTILFSHKSAVPSEKMYIRYASIKYTTSVIMP